MRDLAARNGSEVRGLNGRHSSRPPVESRELYLEGFAVAVHMNHGPHVTNLQALFRYGRGQDNSIVFLDHTEGSLPTRIGRYQARRFRASIDDPDRPDFPSTALLSLRRDAPVDNIFLAVRRLYAFNHFPVLSDSAESAD
jgi:hypothetical protein